MNPHSIAAAIDQWLKWHNGHEAPHHYTADDWAYQLLMARQLTKAIREAPILYFDDPIVQAGLTILNVVYGGANVIRDTTKKSKLAGRLER